MADWTGLRYAVVDVDGNGQQPPELVELGRLAPGQPSYRLGELVSAFELDKNLSPDLAPHRATYYVLVTARLFTRLAASAGTLAVLLEQDTPPLF